MSTYVYTGRMTMRTLPTITADECAQHPNGTSLNHAAHDVRIAKAGGPRGYHYVTVATCPGRHTTAVPVVPSDPFALIPGAHEDDRDL